MQRKEPEGIRAHTRELSNTMCVNGDTARKDGSVGEALAKDSEDQLPSLPLTFWAILGKSVNLAGPQFTVCDPGITIQPPLPCVFRLSALKSRLHSLLGLCTVPDSKGPEAIAIPAPHAPQDSSSSPHPSSQAP